MPEEKLIKYYLIVFIGITLITSINSSLSLWYSVGNKKISNFPLSEENIKVKSTKTKDTCEVLWGEISEELKAMIESKEGFKGFDRALNSALNSYLKGFQINAESTNSIEKNFMLVDPLDTITEESVKTFILSPSRESSYELKRLGDTVEVKFHSDSIYYKVYKDSENNTILTMGMRGPYG